MHSDGSQPARPVVARGRGSTHYRSPRLRLGPKAGSALESRARRKYSGDMKENGPNEVVEWVKSHALSCLPATVKRLENYLRVPAISCQPEHHRDVRALAEQVQADLSALGFDARCLQLPGALPAVAATRLCSALGAPTLLIYGHLDLQPVRGESWSSDPHRAVTREGRLYARGAADDMGGWVSHLAALEAWLSIASDLPLNVKLFLEGEEEIGSPNLERYMDAHPDCFEADFMVLTDCENPSEEVPGLTTSLRGLMEVEVRCEALQADVHSGLWGNAVPDAGNALVLLLARLLDEQGRMKLGRVPIDGQTQQCLRDVPLSCETVRQAARLLDGVQPLPEDGRSLPEWMWRQPAVTILSTSFPRADEHKNAIRRAASAVLSLRIAPGQSASELFGELERVLLAEPPGGVKVSVTERPGGAESWLYRAEGPAFDAAQRAYEKAWGAPLLPIGIGGSIPFVALFGRRFAELPLILNGVLDPESGAHGPDESLHMGIFEKAIVANIHLYDELSRVATSP